ncbi:flavin reductase [Micromonospora chalcea]
MSVATEHVPDRPLWCCRVDSDPWPCAPAKEALLAEYAGARTALVFYLTCQMVEAREDLAEMDSGHPPDGLLDRFVSWARVGCE